MSFRQNVNYYLQINNFVLLHVLLHLPNLLSWINIMISNVSNLKKQTNLSPQERKDMIKNDLKNIPAAIGLSLALTGLNGITKFEKTPKCDTFAKTAKAYTINCIKQTSIDTKNTLKFFTNLLKLEKFNKNIDKISDKKMFAVTFALETLASWLFISAFRDKKEIK